tara:strand:+ start:1689 stop:2120 length:432 start_codon:yes stop_codon:yes gene_type:complete
MNPTTTVTSWVLSPDHPNGVAFQHNNNQHPWHVFHREINRNPPYMEHIGISRAPDRVRTLVVNEEPDERDRPFTPFGGATVVYGHAILCTEIDGDTTMMANTSQEELNGAGIVLDQRHAAEEAARQKILAILASCAPPPSAQK